MKKLLLAFRDVANAPTNYPSLTMPYKGSVTHFFNQIVRATVITVR